MKPESHANSSPTLSIETQNRLRAVRRAARDLRRSSIATRNQVLHDLKSRLLARQSEILQANEADIKSLVPTIGGAFTDRLLLTPERLKGMRASLDDVIRLPDPLAGTYDEKRLSNGLLLKRVRSPLGVILMIFEARPNVITEAFSLALKSGNALIMRGGSESLNTSRVLYETIAESLKSAGLSTDVFWGILDPDRALSQALMRQDKFIDVLVPRGGDSLIEYVTQNATIPIIKNDRGLCHVYVHEDADEAMALEIIANAKTQRPGVCNSMETLLLHEAKKSLLPKIYARLKEFHVEWFACPESMKVLGSKPDVYPVAPASFDTEYLDFKINCRIVSSLEDALEHIEQHGSRHSECIVTSSESASRYFQSSVDAAVVYWNASTRFTDGYQFGLGGELGISTQKLHVRGPVGLHELTSLRWIADGMGQIR